MMFLFARSASVKRIYVLSALKLKLSENAVTLTNFLLIGITSKFVHSF